MALFIGLMSGTSLDGVDAVLVDAQPGAVPQSLAHIHRPFADALRDDLLRLNQPGDNELHAAALAGNAVARAYASAVTPLLEGAGVPPASISALGAHGQTVRHRPGEYDGTGYTIQLLNGALLAELTGIDVVCDFRSRDVAAGGEGAPLVPAVHRALFGRRQEAVAVLNLGGIGNLTLLPPTASGIEPVLGFDCGPGNALMDGWCHAHTGHPFDDSGRWAVSGTVDATLLARLLDEPYFHRAPPKSTGRDLFHRGWLLAALSAQETSTSPRDVQATLAELTAVAAAKALQRHAPGTRKLLVCGGGALNTHLMHRLAASLPGVSISTTAEHGVPVDQVEAIAFAWLAQAFVERSTGNLPSVTGAIGPRILGTLYPGRFDRP